MKHYSGLAFKLCIACFMLLSVYNSRAQGGTWTWVHGPAGIDGLPVYGIKGVPSVYNNPPALYEALTWADKQGNFWIYGGLDTTRIERSDLWKYDPVANTWTWVQGPGITGQPPVYGIMGVPAVTNTPGGRSWGATTWTDANNNLWFYAGAAVGEAYSDLWKYDIATNEWTWMNGSITESLPTYGIQGTPSSLNTPGARSECTSSWVDASGNLWLFGGLLSSGGVVNDMWTYNILTNQWTWMSGANTTGDPGSYGSMGVTASTNRPPARMSYTNWKDVAGNFYIFGGSSISVSTFSDVWKYDPVQNLWTWVAGENFPGSSGQYGQYCTGTGSTGPQARYENRTAQISGCSGSAAFSFGGFITSLGTLNDLWLFDMQHSQWIFVSGTGTPADAGNYGTMGVPAITNLPPSRAGQSMWMQNNGTLWLFGGWGPTETSFYSDMWKFTPNTSCVTIPLAGGIDASLQQNLICIGDSTMLTITGADNIHISPAGSVHLIDTAQAWLVPDTTTTYLITGNSVCRNNDTGYITLNVTRPGVLNYTLSDTQLCQGTTAELTLLGQNATAITPLTGVVVLDSIHYLLQPAVTTTYTLNGTSAVCGGSNSAQFTIYVTQHTPVSITVPDIVNCSGNYDTATVTGLSNIIVTTNANYYFLDSGHILFYSDYVPETPVIINGTTSCGSLYADTFNLTWETPGYINYELSNSEICQYDTALLTLYGVTNTRIEPDIWLTWLDSAHVQLYPSVNTTYTVYGSNQCAANDSASFTVNVIQPGKVNYSFQSNGACGEYNYVYLYIYGLNNAQLVPAAIYQTIVDTGEIEAEFYIDSPITIIVTGQSVCGGNDTASILLTNGISLIINGTEGQCLGDSNGVAQVTANGGYSPYTYIWSNGNNTAAISGLVSGNYTVTVTSQNLCSATGSVTVSQPPQLLVLTDIDTATCGQANGGAVINVSGGTKPYTYVWQPAVSHSAAATGIDSGFYKVTITDSAGCTLTDTFTISSTCNDRLAVPNAFTPNGDGKNDFFKPLFIDAPAKYTMHIYNRWGQLVFETTELTPGWDGNFKNKPQPTGTFLYYIQYNYPGQKTQGLEGALELIR